MQKSFFSRAIRKFGFFLSENEYSTVSKRPSQKQFQNICENREYKKFFVSNQKVLLSSFLRAHPPHPWLMESNGKCRRYVALQSHGRSHRRCTSECTHPQRSPLGKCHVASKWQGIFPATYQTNNNNIS